jgi:hypothetical protein
MRVFEDPHYVEMKPGSFVALFRSWEKPMPEPGQIIEVKVFGGSVKVFLKGAETYEGTIPGMLELGINGQLVKI